MAKRTLSLLMRRKGRRAEFVTRQHYLFKSVRSMSKVYEELDDRLCQFIEKQKIFFVGSSPLRDDGLVNISPKGMDSLRILDSTTVAYLDFTGSGIETVAHVKENGRLAIMFCSFDTSPMIVRLHGRAKVVETTSDAWERMQPLFPASRMARAIIILSITRISDSCGWGVPMYEYVGERDQYQKYAERIDDSGLRQAQLESNLKSIDGLPGLERPSI